MEVLFKIFGFSVYECFMFHAQKSNNYPINVLGKYFKYQFNFKKEN